MSEFTILFTRVSHKKYCKFWHSRKKWKFSFFYAQIWLFFIYEVKCAVFLKMFNSFLSHIYFIRKYRSIKKYENCQFLGVRNFVPCVKHLRKIAMRCLFLQFRHFWQFSFFAAKVSSVKQFFEVLPACYKISNGHKLTIFVLFTTPILYYEVDMR